MAELAHFLFHAAVVGIGATLVMDAWRLCQKHVFGVPVLEYAMVGRCSVICYRDACAMTRSRTHRE